MPYTEKSQTPLTIDEFSTLLKPFPFLEAMDTFAVGVSGGADSLALTLLLHEWASFQGKQLIALTVDHGLRLESFEEAQQVKTWLTVRGITHEILQWEGIKPCTRVQEKAREVRYDLLTHWCETHHIPILFLAHHAQDQIETFLMRLAKGSGLRGLCAIRSCQMKARIQVLRPFLKIHPLRLEATLKRFQQSFLQDPSNQNLQFERIRWREALPAFQQQGLNFDAILNTIDQLQENQGIIDEQLKELANAALYVSPHGYLQMDETIFRAQSPAMQQLFLGCILQLFSKQGFCPKQKALGRLHKQLYAGNRRIWTLSGCLIQRKNKTLLFFRELRAAEQPQLLPPNTSYVWDHRFLVCSPLNESVILKPLGLKGLSQISLIPQTIPSRALITLPSLWQEDNLLKCAGLDFSVNLYFRPNVLWLNL